MKSTITKSISSWITIIAIIFFGFYLTTQRSKYANELTVSLDDNAAEKILDDKDYSVRQKLINDFEIAFLKQYTPLVGCEVFESGIISSKCSQHLIQAKYEFKKQFVTTRGLPKNTFEKLELSFAD
ncbi:MAG: hypothetical protein P8X88_07705 [Gammaproteobacteria bacterium]